MREPEDTDSVDLAHVMHFPYVDIATCDRQSYAAISAHVAQARGPRAVTLYRNNQLQAILEHIEELPTAEEILEGFLTPPQ